MKQLAHPLRSRSQERVLMATNSEPLNLKQVLQNHEGVFKEEHGTLKGFKATIWVPTDVVPRFYRP